MTGGLRPSTVTPSMSSTSDRWPETLEGLGQVADLHLISLQVRIRSTTASRSSPGARGRPGRRGARGSAAAGRPHPRRRTRGGRGRSASTRECERNPSARARTPGAPDLAHEEVEVEVVAHEEHALGAQPPARSRGVPSCAATARSRIAIANVTVASARNAVHARTPARRPRTAASPRERHGRCAASRRSTNGRSAGRRGRRDRRLEHDGEPQQRDRERARSTRSARTSGRRDADRPPPEHRDQVGDAEGAPDGAVALGVAARHDALRGSRTRSARPRPASRRRRARPRPA